MVIVELVFGIGPETFTAVDVATTAGYQNLVVVDPEVFPKLMEGVVAGWRCWCNRQILSSSCF